MFVVKNSTNHDAIDIIAGEMLNREFSLNHFVNGVARTELPPDYIGYPSYITGTRKYVLKAVAGFIYIPANISLDWFVKIITEVLAGKEIARLDGQELSSKCAHSLANNVCTTIMMVPKNPRSFSITNGQLTNGTKGTSRFLWQIRHINDIDTTVLGKQPDITIQRLAGIFWDTDDILSLPHGTLTFTFSDKSFKAHSRMCNDKESEKAPTLTIFPAASNPLLFELNKYWQESVPGTDAKEFVRDVNRRKLVSANFDQVEVKPIRVDDESATMSTEICFRCKEPLYGEIYGLSGYVTKQDEPIVNNGKIIITPICPLCLHTTPEDSPIESKFVRVIRLMWPRSPQDMINICEFSETKADICREALKKITPCKTKVGDSEIMFYLIGDKYVGFQHNRDFKYTKMVNAPFLEGRMECKVVVVQ